MKDMKRLLKEYLREAIIWRQLEHPNILPCLGLYYLDDTHERICLVSPWMENGNLADFLQGRPSESVDHLQLMHDIANGLSYLHASKIVNILITSSQRACIADFGLSKVADSQIFRVTSTVQTGGTARWCAPELHSSEPASTKSDVYSCGCLFYEIITGLPPFHELKRDPAIVVAVLHGKRPSKPENNRFPDDWWSLVNSCWEADRDMRPTAEDILQRLSLARNVLPAEDWKNILFIELRRNVISRLPWVGQQHQEMLDMLTAAEITGEPRADHFVSADAAQQFMNVHQSYDDDCGSSVSNEDPRLRPLVHADNLLHYNYRPPLANVSLPDPSLLPSLWADLDSTQRVPISDPPYSPPVPQHEQPNSSITLNRLGAQRKPVPRLLMPWDGLPGLTPPSRVAEGCIRRVSGSNRPGRCRGSGEDKGDVDGSTSESVGARPYPLPNNRPGREGRPSRSQLPRLQPSLSTNHGSDETTDVYRYGVFYCPITTCWDRFPRSIDLENHLRLHELKNQRFRGS
ncbi:hypothetical protein VNI00_013600 [Paramarasmius palmivorus]|uniref:Protein kinase domain-containing protein n=1 Tax=Paramarasmius palmivorus TaxID=297713 RepID=A0AAW0BY60_9AGAR